MTSTVLFPSAATTVPRDYARALKGTVDELKSKVGAQEWEMGHHA